MDMTTMTTTQRTSYSATQIAQLFPSLMKINDNSLRERVAAVWNEAIILADLGMNPATFNGIFMIARTPGLVAHVIEEQTREKPMRRIDPVKHGYDGPALRSVPE